MKADIGHKVYFNYLNRILPGIVVILNDSTRITVAYHNKRKPQFHYKSDKKHFVYSEWCGHFNKDQRSLKTAFKLVKRYKLNETCIIKVEEINKTIKEYYSSYLIELYK